MAVVAPKAGGKALALAVAPLKGLTADQTKLELDEVQRAIRKALKKALGKPSKNPRKRLPWGTLQIQPKSVAAGSARQVAPPTKPFRESGDVFSAQKALVLRRRIVRNFWRETGEVIPHALNLDLFITDFHRHPRRGAYRPPLAAHAQNIHQPVDDFSHVHVALVAAATRRRNQRSDMRPFGVRHIARITQLAAIIPLQSALLPLQRLPLVARDRRRSPRADFRRALFRRVAAPYI